ncbi:AAA family ATPase [Microbacterium sp. LRZ72]|uniref:DEAD/DEAH box helicase n=1 Tax=Microbacterium sp. LRZ72 TaxID=2942481 RepID=UPI0029B6E96D|nr:AAA family ATPase [Microbacterium sp. LRZ72]MDX2375913.1 AAA family ATPase [Microbacterium sp. LRZ72]
MWRGDENAVVAGEDAPVTAVAPHDLSVADPSVTVVNAADADRSRLRAEAAQLGGRSPLLQFVLGADTGIDITNAHPGSLPQFITGQSTLLSGLFRDEVALRTARLAAEAITAKNVELRTVRSIDAVHLAVGLSSWRLGGVTYSAPVLLRPLAIRRHGADFELKLYGGFHINPELASVAREHFGIALDGPALAALAHEHGVFKPQRVIDRLRQLTTHIDTFTVQPRLVVSTFADVGRAMSRDGVTLPSVVLDALGGHAAARESLATQAAEARATSVDERPPAADTLLLDADAEQEHVLAQITAGRSIVVQTLPGTGGTQTVINAVGALVQNQRRVLVVSARRSTIEGVRHRMQQIGLPGFACAPATAGKDLVRAIGRNEKAAAPALGEVDEALVRLRTLLSSYRRALTAPAHGLGVTPLDTVRALAGLQWGDHSARASTRFDFDTLMRLSGDRSEAAQKLRLAAQLGEFRFGPDDSPWYGATFSTTQEAQTAHALARRLNTTDVPRLLERGYELIAQTRMRPFGSIDELGDYLRLLIDIRDSLDRFSPSVFERPLGDLIRAVGSRRDGAEMRSGERRRLRRLAREYVRPGVHVADMHEALSRIQRQRTQWQRYVESGVAPEVPLGLEDVHVAWQRVAAELAELDGPLGRELDRRLAALPVERLVRTLGGLAAESDVLDNLIERTSLRGELSRMGLGALLSELSVRHVPADRVENELEYAWWQSALEHMLRSDKSLLGANTGVVDRLERDFRLVDEAHAAASGKLLAWQLAREWKIGLVDHPDEADALKVMLTRGEPSPANLAVAAPTLGRVLAPVWLASPYDVPQLPEFPAFDTVIIADGGAIDLAEAAPAIRRARQVVVLGDPVTQKPTPFALAAGTVSQEEPEVAFDDTSVFERLADLLPVYTLTRSYRAGGEDLAELVNDAFYGGEIVSWPWAGSYLGRGSLAIDYVEGGFGAPDPVSGAVESPDTEVARVVTLVVEHAVNRPNESLMVITASARHAERVRAAVNAAFSRRGDVAAFALRDTAEPFAVLTLEQSVAESRDRVVFSLGYGLTKHGRVLSDFGDLSTPDGERLLTVGMTRARRSMVIVSSIRPSAFDDGRLEHGAATLMSVLGGMSARSRDAQLEDLADPLTRRLAAELRALGVVVDVHYRGLLPLVAQHGGKAVVVESDPERHSESLREALRLRPQLLRRLGWHYVRVHSFDLYTDPAAVAARIGAILGLDPEPPALETSTQPIDVIE